MKTVYLTITILILVLTLSSCDKDSSPTGESITVIVTNDSAYYSNDDFSFYPLNVFDSNLVVPQPISSKSPMYPEYARVNHIEGEVWIKFLILDNGSVKRCYVLQTTDSVFNKPSLTASMQWIFSPAKINGKPTHCYVSVPFKYRFRQIEP